MNLCYCCLLRLPQMDLKTPYIRLGVTEIFSEMIKECFKIHLFLDNEDECGICEKCVDRLRDASDFKLQVQRSQAELQSRLERPHGKHKYKEPVVKSEIPDGDADEVMDTGDIWIPILESTSELPAASTQPVSTTERLLACSESYDDVGARAQVSSKSDSFENQFTMFINSNEQTEPKLKGKTGTQQHNKLKRRKRTKGPYSCVTCPAILPTKALLIEHKRTHKTKDHTCHICNKKFKIKYKMMDHIRRHNGQKPFSCEICNKNFTSNSSLWTHNLIHKGVAFICDHCGKKYTRRSDLVAHMNVHNEKSRFKCDICGIQFVYKYALGAHQVVHSKIKPFRCDVCGKEFRRKEHLKTHNLTHSGQKPYSCEICDQRCTTKPNLKRHKEKIHGQKNL